MAGFIVNDRDNTMIFDTEQDGSDEEDLFDSVCAICDDGGEVLCCKGKCMRSFHATVDSGEESLCKTLGFSEDQVEAMQSFLCKNCQYKQYQCFSCGELGSSDTSTGAEVFPCVSATCGHFYHPQCVAKLLHQDDEAAVQELLEKIEAGASFTCPIHKCHACKQVENKKDHELQFAMCRRCPMSYHRKCLPKNIAFGDSKDTSIIPRAWDNLLPNRILIYCLKHEIDEELRTPKRNHIKFPYADDKKKKGVLALLSSREKVVEKVMLKKRSVVSEDLPQERTAMKAPKQVEMLSSAVREGDHTKERERESSGPYPSKKMKVKDASIMSLNNSMNCVSMKRSELIKPKKQDTPNSESEQTMKALPLGKELSSSLPSLDPDEERRILALIQQSTSSLTKEDVIKMHKVPSTYAYLSKNLVDKTITLGKVEGSIKALRTALQKLEEGCSIEDAKAICEPEVLNLLVKWKNKLKIYLAPFLHGMRYTSFGRHFTKVDKLIEIVEKLHWYVQDGDMIVDFCCGANDFSLLMKEKLEETRKKCSYKNYDVIQPKNDFKFEKRDWMSVKPSELPTGSKLVMGLNPPFGVQAALANKFIDKALEFKPKLLVLIVPQETQRLDKKKLPYDLVWKDDEELSGKSFYLPGSIDVNDKQMEQWNVNPPLLYLWSRPGWTSKHKSVAQKHGHLSKQQKELPLGKNLYQTQEY